MVIFAYEVLPFALSSAFFTISRASCAWEVRTKNIEIKYEMILNIKELANALTLQYILLADQNYG
jgi:hypothetical protein